MRSLLLLSSSFLLLGVTAAPPDVLCCDDGQMESPLEALVVQYGDGFRKALSYDNSS